MNTVIHTTFDTMGTTAIVTMGSEHAWRAASLRSQMVDVCSWFDQTYSTYQADSTVQKLRGSGIERSSWPIHVQDMAAEGEKWEFATSGYFTMTSPSGQWDPTGLVKAKSIESLAILLQAQGITEFSVNIGGDIAYSDFLSSSELSRVAISRPTSIATAAPAPLMVLDLARGSHRAVATSGTAERGEHIWSTSDTGVAQATVVADNIALADIWATALVAGGSDALELFIDQKVGEAIVMTRDHHMIITAGISTLLAETATHHELLRVS